MNSFWTIDDAIRTIPESKDRALVQEYVSNLQRELTVLNDERNFLRSQVSLALRSIKFDMHPELPQ